MGGEMRGKTEFGMGNGGRRPENGVMIMQKAVPEKERDNLQNETEKENGKTEIQGGLINFSIP